MKELGVGVLGLGRLGQVHAHNLARRVKRAQLIAVCDLVENLARDTAGELGCRYYTDLESMLDDKSIDAVVVATPTALHVDPVTKVAEAGKALFCEKPLASTLEDNLHLARVIKDAGITCQIGFNRRFDPDFVQAEQLIREGAIGQPTYFYSVMRDPFPPPPWACNPGEGGGLFIDMLLHDFDIARFLLHDEVSRVSAEETNLVVDGKNIHRFADNVAVNLRFKGGALGNCHASMHAEYGYDVRTEVFGANGSILIGGITKNKVTLCTKAHGVCQPSTFLPEGKIPHAMFRFGEAYFNEMNDFVECVLHGNPVKVNEVDAVEAFKISMACIQSAGDQSPVEV